MNKKEAAQYLNLSTRAVERAVARGKLRVRYSKEKHGNMAIFDQADVQRYKKEIEVPPYHRPHPSFPEPETPGGPGTSPLVFGTAVPVDSSREDGVRAVPLAQKLTLTLPESASLSGLSVAFLLKAIKDHRLSAFEDETDLRVKRTDLDAFVNSL
jgi:hypothetical protein